MSPEDVNRARVAGLQVREYTSVADIHDWLAPRKSSAPFLIILKAPLGASLIRASRSEAHFQGRFVLCLVRREPLDWQGSVWFASC